MSTTKQDIIKYCKETPYNVNIAVLTDLVDDYIDSLDINITPENYDEVLESLYMYDTDYVLHNRTNTMDYLAKYSGNDRFLNGNVKVILYFNELTPSLQLANRIIEMVPTKEEFMGQFTEEQLHSATECSFTIDNADVVEGITEEWCTAAEQLITEKGWDSVSIPFGVG